jgi:c-di-GMP-binding flagellar brake protein YcgR
MEPFDRSGMMSNGPESQSAMAERRAAVRYLCNLKTMFQPGTSAAEDLRWSGVIRDVSVGGLGLVLGRKYDAETILTVELQSKDRRFTRSLVARVVHVSPHEGGRWLHGCAFARPLEERELQALLS